MQHTKLDSLEVLFSEVQIQTKINEIALQLFLQFGRNEEVVLVTVLNGSMPFVVYLGFAMGRLGMDVRLESLKASSYEGIESSGKVTVANVPQTLSGKVVVLVDDILDTGRTMAQLVEMIRECDPKDLCICVLLDKPSRREVKPDIPKSKLVVGETIKDLFVVGFGLDFNGKYRFLPDICVLGLNE